MTSVTEVRSASARLSVRGAPWWVLLQHSIMLRLFFSVECGIARFLGAMHVFEVRTSSSSPIGYHCANFVSFAASIAEPIHGEKSRTQSLNHSPSLFDAPGRKIFCQEERSKLVLGPHFSDRRTPFYGTLLAQFTPYRLAKFDSHGLRVRSLAIKQNAEFTEGG